MYKNTSMHQLTYENTTLPQLWQCILDNVHCILNIAVKDTETSHAVRQSTTT